MDWNILLDKNLADNFSVGNSSWPIEYCSDGWEFNKTIVQSSIVIDVNLCYITYIIYIFLEFILILYCFCFV